MKFFDIILHPVDTMAAELKHVDMQEATKSVAIYGAVVGLMIGLVIGIASAVVGAFAGGMLQSIPIVGILAGLGLAAVIIMPVLVAILVLISMHIMYRVLHFIATYLGGKGTFEQNFYLGSRLLWPMLVANLIVNILTVVPLLGQLLNLVWFFYSIYLMVLVISIANKIGKWKALGVLLIPMVVVTLVMVVLMVVVFSALMGQIAN